MDSISKKETPDVMALGERLTVEFKREYTEEIKKTIAAFANTQGGTLYIGIEDDGSLSGVHDTDDVILRVCNAARTGIKPDLSLFMDCQTQVIEGKNIVRVTVQKGTACPYYLTGKGIRPEGVYVRQGPSSVPASEAAIRKMIKETDGDTYEELRSRDQNLTFTGTEREFTQRGLEFGPRQMFSLKLTNQDGLFTNLGLLLSDQAVHTVKAAVFEGVEKEVFQDRREFSGSLLTQLNEAYDFLEMYNKTHAEVKGLYRIDTRDYPEEALREALLNAVVHREYGFSAGTLISLFEDRIEFVSIGGLPEGISLEDIMLGISVPRNKNLADVFYRLKLIEAYGTGIPKILRAYADSSEKPLIQATGNAFKITLPNRNALSFVAERAPAYGFRRRDEDEAPLFTENEEKVMELFTHTPVLVRKDVEAALSISQAMAVRILRGLLDKRAIRCIGGGKNTRYRLIR